MKPMIFSSISYLKMRCECSRNADKTEVVLSGQNMYPACRVNIATRYMHHAVNS